MLEVLETFFRLLITEGMLLKVVSMLDKLAKNNIIHKNKASNLKSKLTKQVATL